MSYFRDGKRFCDACNEPWHAGEACRVGEEKEDVEEKNDDGEKNDLPGKTAGNRKH